MLRIELCCYCSIDTSSFFHHEQWISITSERRIHHYMNLDDAMWCKHWSMNSSSACCYPTVLALQPFKLLVMNNEWTTTTTERRIHDIMNLDATWRLLRSCSSIVALCCPVLCLCEFLRVPVTVLLFLFHRDTSSFFHSRTTMLRYETIFMSLLGLLLWTSATFCVWLLSAVDIFYDMLLLFCRFNLSRNPAMWDFLRCPNYYSIDVLCFLINLSDALGLQKNEWYNGWWGWPRFSWYTNDEEHFLRCAVAVLLPQPFETLRCEIFCDSLPN